MKKLLAGSLCLCLFFTTGCASIIRGTRQNVRVVSDPPGATIVNDRTMVESIAPAELVLKRKHEYQLRIERQGYKTEYVQVDKHLSGWFWGNLIFGGLIGIIVDLANGAAYNLEPEEVRVKLQRK